MASQKGPRFQVVRLPGQFTRGRWDCWDYREPDQKQEDAGVLVFDSTTPSSTAVPHPGETPSTVPLSSVHTNQTALSNNVSPSNSSHAIGEQNGTIVVTSIAQFQPNVNQNAQVSKPSAVPSAPSQPILSTSSSGKNLNKLGEESEGTSNMGLLNAAANVVAIDNKIEQAMDLVKTHLTFAVREEVETLRNTIAELESKVTNLEQQNQMLRQYAPADVVSNLSNILQSRNQVQHSSGTLSSENATSETDHPKLIRRDTTQDLPH
ncbi:unnamed protein product [Bursaphelenchus xylophilus]|nr:unnamed protein product [Bursaphelenchus xylophilus]CAG9130054.1 unnamed protein product [Bursaphelenchus xylophilus]